MRRSPIRHILADRGAQFAQWAGVEVPTRFSGFETEYRAVREAVGLTDFSSMTRYSMPEDGLDVLEQYAAGAVANIRFGRVLHTFAANEEGYLESDLYIANDDEDLLILGESIIDDDETNRVLASLGAEAEGLVDISGSTSLFGIDGFQAWAVVKELFGADILGLPYLSLETYELEGEDIKLIRGGKTSEFGYLLLVPSGIAGDVWQRIEDAGKPFGMVPVGLDTHRALRLDGRFFCIYDEGARVKDPLPLGLQWMIDLEGDDFRGREAIFARRSRGTSHKIVGVMPLEKEGELDCGSEIYHRDALLGEVVTACDSPVLGQRIGLALIKKEYAFAGLQFRDQHGAAIRTVSMPPFTSKSLTVRLDEM